MGSIIPAELLERLFSSSRCDIEVLAADEEKVRFNAENYGMNDSTLLGAVVSGTGGIVVDRWVRIYGSGALDFSQKNEQLSGVGKMIIAEDVTGGIFGVERSGGISYFAPDTLCWEELGLTLAAFLSFVTDEEKLAMFYKAVGFEYRERLTENLSLSQGLSFYPPLFAEHNVKRSVRAISMNELLAFEKEFSEQFFAGRAMPDSII